MEFEIPPGYVPYGEMGMRLVDPVDCPGGHPFAFGQRTWTPCAEHRGHPSWRCACGVEQYPHRGDGQIVAELECQRS